MPIEVTCELCFRDHKVKSEFAGKTFKCKGCGEPLTVPKPKRSSKATTPVEDDDFLGALDGAAKDRGKTLPPKVASKPKASSSARKSKPAKASSGSGDGNSKAIMGGVGTVVLLLLAVGLKLANKTDILDRLIPSGVGWSQFELRNGDVTLDMPSTPKVKNTPVPGAVSYETYVSEGRKFATSVGYAQFDTSQIPELGRSLFTFNMMKGEIVRELLVEHPGTTMERDEVITIDTMPVAMFVTKSAVKNQQMRLYRYFLLAGDTLYAMEFIEGANRSQDSHREHFVDSIHFSEKVKNSYWEWQGRFKKPASSTPVLNTKLTETEKGIPSGQPEVIPGNESITTSDPAEMLASVDTKPTANPVPESKPEVKPPTATQWTVQPDPPQEYLDWTMADKIEINIASSAKTLEFPNLQAPDFFVIPSSSKLSGTSEFSLETGKPVKSSVAETSSFTAHSFSPDGKQVALYRIKEKIITIWDFENSSKLHELAFPIADDVHLSHLLFLDNEHVLAYHYNKDDFKTGTYYVYDLSNSNESIIDATPFEGQAIHYSNPPVVSPGLNYLVSTTNDNNIAMIVDWKARQVAGKLTIPAYSVTGKINMIKALCFKTDGSEVSLLAETSDSLSMYSFSMADGKIVSEQHFDGDLDDLIPGANYYRNEDYAQNLRWNSDNSAYSICGKMLVDAESQKVLWYLHSLPDKNLGSYRNDRTCHLTPEGMITIESDGLRRQVQLKPFDVFQLQKTLASLDQSDLAILSPGQDVQLEIVVDSVHVGSKEQSEDTLKEIWIENLETQGFNVVDSAELKLRFDYRDLAGKEFTSRKDQKKYPSTDIQFRIQWLQGKSKKALWEMERLYQVGIVFADDDEVVSTELIREKTMERFYPELKRQIFPYFIPKEGDLSMLPAFATTKN
ncbi:WD40 repeat domain-containing protein [Rubinisphaera sp.]|uniref:WD40 repeat domain-containing protein n=1 Tax=Rubinisphaera sp. TaxID=2024857 RepID=UPI0025ED3AAB|nr:WD40 repeat domain-containing protein [Rubinisphaera sp.]